MHSLRFVRLLKRKVLPPAPHFWEYFGRIKFASDIILNSGVRNYSVLDVGGATGNNLLKRFGVQNVKTLDVRPGADIVASASEIPVPDRSFDFVTSLDMLEHAPTALRSKVVEEMIRVSKNKVILIAPLKSSENLWAEELVLKYRHADFLIEHKDQGLVDFGEIEQQLQKLIADHKIKSYERFELDNLLTWVTLMTEDYCDPSAIYEQCYERLENKFVPRRIALVVSHD